MPKVLIAGEKAFAVHSFTDKEFDTVEINETRNDSVIKIGLAFDQPELNESTLNAIKGSVMMLLKQSQTYKLKTESKEILNGYVLAVFKGKNLNGKKNYISAWVAKMPEDAVSKNPEAMIPELLKGFKDHLTMKDYHKKSVVHELVK